MQDKKHKAAFNLNLESPAPWDSEQFAGMIVQYKIKNQAMSVTVCTTHKVAEVNVHTDFSPIFDTPFLQHFPIRAIPQFRILV